MRLTEAIDGFVVSLQANRRSAHTIAAYRRDLAGLVAFIGDRDVLAISRQDVQRFVASDAAQLLDDGSRRSDSTVNRLKAALRSFGQWLVLADARPDDPTVGLVIRRSRRRSPSFLTDTERKRMLREVTSRKGSTAERDRVMLEVFLGTGIRLAELVGLDTTDVDLEGKHLTIHAKGGQTETRFLKTDLRALLRRYLRQRASVLAETNALFLSAYETRISTRQVQERFHEWLRWTGIDRPDLSVHSLRHTFGTRLYRKTHDLVLVGKALGHRSLESTRVYVHEDTEALEEALESL